MLTKTKIVLIAAVLLGSASQAFAIDPDGFDVDIFRPNATTPRGAAQTMQAPRGFVQAPARLGNGAGGPFTVATQRSYDHPNADLRYGPQPDYPQSPAGIGGN